MPGPSPGSGDGTDGDITPIDVGRQVVPPPLPNLRGSDAEVRSLERHVCPKCGGKGEWYPRKRQLVCPYCGTEFDRTTPPPLEGIEEHDLDEMLARLGADSRTVQTGERKVQCTHCHAVLTRDASNVARRCDFCGSPELLDYDEIDAVLRPESILPAIISKEEAYHKLKEFLSSRWLAPNALKTRNLVDFLHGIYLPYWTFDSQVECPWTAQSGTYYYVTVSRRNAQGKYVSHRERRVRWRPASGHVSTFFDDVLVAGSTGLGQKILAALEPYPTDKLVPYETSYVSGWDVEQYQIPLSDAAKKALAIMEGLVRDACAAQVPGDTYANLKILPKYNHKTFKHILCPVWMLAYQYGNKTYRGAVNAYTGSTWAHFPRSFWKVSFFVLGILLAVVLLVYGYIYLTIH